ncbi:hypothetical protein B0H17DRAFT_1132878 [Mycena rosella]|uniref:Uncharacterized protein n=1 Tax=Mycena rosella TaxID=1033263 RepID=A0AAD7GFU4_MYCRO|nr:hypothetical protein B0H17DRAFT_1132878 [Mycena rosella]
MTRAGVRFTQYSDAARRASNIPSHRVPKSMRVLLLTDCQAHEYPGQHSQRVRRNTACETVAVGSISVYTHFSNYTIVPGPLWTPLAELTVAAFWSKHPIRRGRTNVYNLKDIRRTMKNSSRTNGHRCTENMEPGCISLFIISGMRRMREVYCSGISSFRAYKLHSTQCLPAKSLTSETVPVERYTRQP